MGRGRIKAKQTKAARELKYHTEHTDLAALAAELGRQDNNTFDEPATYVYEDVYDEDDDSDGSDSDSSDSDSGSSD